MFLFITVFGPFRCIDRCTNRRSFETYRIVPASYRFVINKDDFSDKEWSEGILSYHHQLNSIREDCESSFANTTRLCDEVKCEPTTPTDGPNQESLELYVDLVVSTEEPPSGYSLLLDILAIQSIFYGVSAFKLFRSIYRLIDLKLRLNGNKLPLFLIFLACWFGFSWHIYRIFDLILNSDLTFSQHHKLARRISMPDVLFCFPIDTGLIDERRKLTGDYLEEITAEMNAESIFASISYLNESNGWTTLSAATGFAGGTGFRMSTFFFLDCKCFSLSLDQVYQRDQFHFSLNAEVLKINFTNPTAMGGENTIHLMTKTRSKMELSKIIKLDVDFKVRWISISQEIEVISYEDRFNALKLLIKNPLLLFDAKHDANDVSLFTRQILSGFWERHRKVTRNLPIQRNLFKFEIDDPLFERYFNETHTDQRPTNFNNRREFAINHLNNFEKVTGQQVPDFVFSLIFLKKVILATNDYGNYGKVLLNLLNVLSIWFGAHLPNLPAYLLAIKQFFTLFGRSSLRAWKSLLPGRPRN